MVKQPNDPFLVTGTDLIERALLRRQYPGNRYQGPPTPVGFRALAQRLNDAQEAARLHVSFVEKIPETLKANLAKKADDLKKIKSLSFEQRQHEMSRFRHEEIERLNSIGRPDRDAAFRELREIVEEIARAAPQFKSAVSMLMARLTPQRESYMRQLEGIGVAGLRDNIERARLTGDADLAAAVMALSDRLSDHDRRLLDLHKSDFAAIFVGSEQLAAQIALRQAKLLFDRSILLDRHARDSISDVGAAQERTNLGMAQRELEALDAQLPKPPKVDDTTE
jgi:hypothetical protein